MSDGGRESGRDNRNNNAQNNNLSASSGASSGGGGDDFGRAVAKVAVALVCEAAGVQGSRRSALDALADILIRYIHDLGKSARFYANLSSRTECNVFDIVQGLEDLESSHGFPGASDIYHCADSSGVVKEIIRFVNVNEENPFARPIPNFPIARQPKLTSSFAQAGETPVGKHIPDWLPVFPDQHTYIHTPLWNEKKTDRKADKIEQVKQRRQAERSLLSLQQRLASVGAAVPAPVVDADVGKGKQVVSSNPFLAPPLPISEKQVSEVVVPEETVGGKRLSILETFAPAIEAAKHGSFDSAICSNRVLPSKRPTVHFKFGVDKGSVAAQVGLGAQAGKPAFRFLREDEKDDKKRRAEMILKEAMEKPDGLAQL